MPGLLRRLFRRRSESAPLPAREPLRQPAARPNQCQSVVERQVQLRGSKTLEVVGESFQQDELWALVGGRCVERVSEDIVAVLVPDPHNPYDANAIEVRINAKPVGHLSRTHAAAYLPGLHAQMQRSDGAHVALSGVIAGGGQRENGIGFLGVFLHHDPKDFGIVPERTVETLWCARCGESFDRPLKPGRKPRLCPACRKA
jgi:hypothetical protein